MTTVVVPADPPREGLVLQSIVETTPLDAEEATRLYTATLQDTCRAVAQSGGDLLVNYRPPDLLPATTGADDPASEIRTVLEEAVDVDVEDVRFEPQVGSTVSARLGNAITHLLEEEDTGTAAVLYPDAPLVARTTVDSLAMALRRTPVVLVPGGRGSIALAGFTTPVDFSSVFTPPALTRVTDRALAEGLEVDFSGGAPRLQTGESLLSTVLEIRARDRADRIVPPHTAATIEGLPLQVTVEDETPRITRA